MPLDLDEYSVTNLRNIDDLSSRSRAGVSNSATRPIKVSNIKRNKEFIDPDMLKVERVLEIMS